MPHTKRQGKHRQRVEQDDMKDGFLPPINPSLHHSDGDSEDSDSEDPIMRFARHRPCRNPRRNSNNNQSSLSDSFVLPRITASPEDDIMSSLKKSKTLLNFYPRRKGRTALPASKSCPALSNRSSADFSDYEMDYMSMSFNVSDFRKHGDTNKKSNRSSRDKGARKSQEERDANKFPGDKSSKDSDERTDTRLPDIFKHDSCSMATDCGVNVRRDDTTHHKSRSMKVNGLKSTSLKRSTAKETCRGRPRATQDTDKTQAQGMGKSLFSSGETVDSVCAGSEEIKEPACPTAFEWEDDSTANYRDQHHEHSHTVQEDKFSKQKGKVKQGKHIDKGREFDGSISSDLTGDAKSDVKCCMKVTDTKW